MHDSDPYSPPAARLVVDPASAELVLAGRGVRLAASFIDGLLMLAILMPMMFAGGYFDGLLRGVQPSLGSHMAWGAIGFVVFVLVQGYPLHANGQTWAKKLLGIRIVDLAGNTPEFGRLVALRYATTHAITLIPFVGMWYALVDSLFIFGEERRCLHDRIAGTRVVLAK